MTDESNTITIARVNELLGYDPATGELYRKVKTSNRAPEGPVGGVPNSEGYLRVGMDGKRYLAHRVAWVIYYGHWPKEMIDHENGIKTDNRIVNLREASAGQNQRNRGKQLNNTTGFKGVFYYKNGYRAIIHVDGKQINLGRRRTPEEASRLYIDAALKYHGNFAKI